MPRTRGLAPTARDLPERSNHSPQRNKFGYKSVGTRFRPDRVPMPRSLPR